MVHTVFFSAAASAPKPATNKANAINGHADVPVIGGSDKDGVQFLQEKLAIIHVRGRGALGSFFDSVAARCIDVAHSSDLVVGDLVGGVEQVIHAATGAYDSDAQRVVGAENAG